MRAGPGPGRSRRQRRLPRNHRPRPRDPAGPESRQPGDALVCGECGQLDWPEEVSSAQPHRRDGADGAARTEECSHCGEHAWIDVGRETTALMLHQHEERAAEGRIDWMGVARVGVGGGTVGAFAGMFIGTLGGVSLLAGLSAVLAGAWVVRQHRRLAPEPSSLPSRWAMALPPAGPVGEVVRGPARPSGELLTAPLSGRRCVAYEVGVRHDDGGSAPASTWVLLEQRVAALEVGGQHVEPSTTHLALARQYLGPHGTVELDAAAEVFLRQRGLGSQSTALELFETIVEPEAEVVLERAEHGATLTSPGALALR